LMKVGEAGRNLKQFQHGTWWWTVGFWGAVHRFRTTPIIAPPWVNHRCWGGNRAVACGCWFTPGHSWRSFKQGLQQWFGLGSKPHQTTLFRVLCWLIWWIPLVTFQTKVASRGR
jgi:hypothetical protein